MITPLCSQKPETAQLQAAISPSLCNRTPKVQELRLTNCTICNYSKDRSY